MPDAVSWHPQEEPNVQTCLVLKHFFSILSFVGNVLHTQQKQDCTRSRSRNTNINTFIAVCAHPWTAEKVPKTTRTLWRLEYVPGNNRFWWSPRTRTIHEHMRPPILTRRHHYNWHKLEPKAFGLGQIRGSLQMLLLLFAAACCLPRSLEANLRQSSRALQRHWHLHIKPIAWLGTGGSCHEHGYSLILALTGCQTPLAPAKGLVFVCVCARVCVCVCVSSGIRSVEFVSFLVCPPPMWVGSVMIPIMCEEVHESSFQVRLSQRTLIMVRIIDRPKSQKGDVICTPNMWLQTTLHSMITTYCN